MIAPFNFARLPRIIFGRGKREMLPPLLKGYRSGILLVTGKSSFIDTAAGSEFIEGLLSEGITYRHVTIPSEPSVGMIDSTVRYLSSSPTGVIVAIGGGSVIDAGKAISAMLGKEISVRHYLEVIGDLEHPGNKVPFIAVPTTSGTGSEATKNAVISKVGHDGFKRSLRHDAFVPDIALVDPELTVTCPAEITAAAGMDCFTQLTEAFLSTRACSLTDALALEGITAVSRSLLRCYHDGADIDARSDMSYAALLSGICLANAGLGAVHGIAGTAGGMFNIPHGVVCGTLMAEGNRANVRVLRETGSNPGALAKYAVLGKIFAGNSDRSEDYYTDLFIDTLSVMTGEMHLPLLGKFGISSDDTGVLASSCDNKNNPVELSVEDIRGIISSRL